MKEVIQMDEKDIIIKDYMQDREIFADAFNFLIYNGKQVIKPEQLNPLDTTSIVLPHSDTPESDPMQKYYDVLQMVVAMADNKATYLILCVENQSEIYYAMHMRNMLCNAIQYVTQLDDIAMSHEMSDKLPETRTEYFSGFYKTDKLLPVITLTLYFGADEWTAPRDLHGMLSADKEILQFVNNYHLHLIAPAEISDDDFTKFHTELSLVLKYIKYSTDKKKLQKIVNEEPAFKSISKKTADVINIITNAKLDYNN